MKNAIVFHYARNKTVEFEIKNIYIVTLHKHSLQMKQLGINQAKYVLDLHEENY